MAEICSYCGESGHSIQSCPKWKKEMSPSSPLVFTVSHLDKLQRFRTLVDSDMFERMFVSAGGTVGGAQHLWYKLRGYDFDIIKWWSELDFENRERFVKMLNAWSGLVPTIKSKKWRVWFTTPMGFERFIDVEAATEEEAKTKASAQVPAGSEHRYTVPQE